jgi:hypothetical protein
LVRRLLEKSLAEIARGDDGEVSSRVRVLLEQSLAVRNGVVDEVDECLALLGVGLQRDSGGHA